MPYVCQKKECYMLISWHYGPNNFLDKAFWHNVCYTSFTWFSQGIVTESGGADVDDHIFTIVDNVSDTNKNSSTNENSEGFLMTEEESESSVASVEEQLRKEMTVYEV